MIAGGDTSLGALRLTHHTEPPCVLLGAELNAVAVPAHARRTTDEGASGTGPRLPRLFRR